MLSCNRAPSSEILRPMSNSSKDSPVSTKDFPGLDGSIKQIEGHEEVQALDFANLISFEVSVGNKIPPLESSAGRFGAFSIRADSREELTSRINQVMTKIRIQ